MKKEPFEAPFKGRSLLTWLNWKPEEILNILSIAQKVKNEAQNNEIHQRFLGKTIALIFEKRSTRTRCAFQTAFGEEGGHPVFLSTHDIQLGSKESIEDTARVLGRMFSAIEFRGFKQKHVEKLAKFSNVPVINGLTDEFHPTQVLADMLTLKEHFGYLKGLKLVFIGDGRNNMATSLMIMCTKLGIHFTVITPKQLFPPQNIITTCTPFATESLAQITVSEDITLVKNADCIYTDVWTSMGEETFEKTRTKLLAPYQVNKELMKLTEKKETVFLHCLPAVKGKEVTKDVFESTASKVWNQAENRKHTIKAIMLAII